MPISHLDLDLLPLSTWLKSGKRKLIIAGPCGAESEDQVLETAKGIARNDKVSLFRSGVWKPRTRPGAFEGMGEEALKWLNRVQKEIGLPVTVEVANAQHVELALKYGVDVLWIGARTTVNPFSVQEIADALLGVDIPVLVKNPVNADLPLWIGALERLNRAGIKKLGAIHRGFHTNIKTQFRNAPMWELAIELKASCPSLPVICDPSHISGRRDLILEVAQRAMDLDMDGLMIETHVNPKVALSDAKQQVTPAELKTIISDLKIRSSSIQSRELQTKLDELRLVIGKLDKDLLELLAKRMAVSTEIGIYKRDNNITILQVSHWAKLIESSLETANQLGLREDFIKGIYQLIHDESILRQTDVMNKK